MKRIITLFMLTALMAVGASQLSAQNAKHGMTFRINWLNHITPVVDADKSFGDRNLGDIWSETDLTGVEVGYLHHFKNRLSLAVPVKMALGRVPASASNFGLRHQLFTGDVLAQYMVLPEKYMLTPYLQLGAGTMYDRNIDQWDLNIPMGLGLALRFSPEFALTAQSQYRLSAGNDRHGWHHGFGALINFGGVTPPPPPPPADRDGDGVIDLTDACPDVPGPAATMGCPDADADGIADKDDKCPSVAGVAALMGCPDKDGDGITDADDACPEQKGIASFKGCPDTDGDGIQDKEDMCPREKGTISTKGCPDTDGDGIMDKDDACPKDKGTAATKGCPDTDGDGIMDKEDACPNKPGPVDHKGCPDTDGDGVYDNEDRCPEKPGVAKLRGCPEIKKEDKAKLERAIKLVQFESGKDVLLQQSYAVLDEVVSVMNQYSEYSLNIGGHTDSQGDDAKNQDLSNRRAKACYDYLVGKGIKADRMAYAGYGETKPVADNATAAGRAQNRRVEFELYVK